MFHKSSNDALDSPFDLTPTKNVLKILRNVSHKLSLWSPVKLLNHSIFEGTTMIKNPRGWPRGDWSPKVVLHSSVAIAT